MANKLNNSVLVGGGSRDVFFDNLKAVLIILVVVLHSFSFFFKDRAVLAVYEVIITFTMPLFIFISGYFTKVKDKNRYLKSTANLLILFIVNHMLRVLVKYLTTGEFSWEWVSPLYSFFGLWYLAVLIIYRMTYYFTSKFVDKYALWLVGVSFVVSLFFGMVNTNVMTWLQRLFNYLPYFFLGIYVRQTDLIEKAKRIKWQYSVAVFALLLVAFYVYGKDLHKLFWLELPYSYFKSYSVLTLMGFKCAQFLASMVLGACLMGLLAPLKKGIPVDTLFIYIYHLWILKPFGKMVINHFHVQPSLLSAVATALATFSLLWLLSLLPFTKKILKPIK